MSDLFDVPKRRIARAKHHIDDLKIHIREYLDSQPCIEVRERDPETGDEFLKIKLVKPVPPALDDFAFDTLVNLRAALDNVAYATALAISAPRVQYAHFPFADGPVELDNLIKGRCKDLHPGIQTFFRGFNPHKGGNDFLWGLNKMCNANKHTLLMPVGVRFGASQLRYNNFSGAGGIYLPVWDREKNEMLVHSVKPGTSMEYNFEFTFFIAFGELDIFRGDPADAVLHTMASEAERVVLGTEAESRRLGLIL